MYSTLKHYFFLWLVQRLAICVWLIDIKLNDCVVNRCNIKNVLFATFFQDSQCKSSHIAHGFIYSPQKCCKFNMGIN